MELKEGEKPFTKERQDHARRAHGYCSVIEISRYLKIGVLATQKHMAALGIVLEPFVRREKYMTKVYKRRTRLLTEQEAERIIARHRSMQGRDDD